MDLMTFIKGSQRGLSVDYLDKYRLPNIVRLGVAE